MPRRPLPLARPAIAALVLAAACAGRAPRAAHDAAYDAPRAVARATVDTIATRLAELELRRVALEASGLAESPHFAQVDRQLAALRELLGESLRALPDRAPAERAVARRLLAALDARQAGLAVQRRQMLATYTEESPFVRQAVAEERALERRRAALREGAGR